MSEEQNDDLTLGNLARSIWNRVTQPLDTTAHTLRGLSGAGWGGWVDPDGSLEALTADTVTGAEYKDGEPQNTAARVLSNPEGRSVARIAVTVAGVAAGVYALWILYRLAPLAAQTTQTLGSEAIRNAGGVGQLVRAVR